MLDDQNYVGKMAMRVVDVYVYRIWENEPQFLLLRRAPDKQYANQWRMVGGKIKLGEAAWQTGLRELKEETEQNPMRFWVLPSVNVFYEWQKDRINLTPAFAAELSQNPVLNHEHDAFEWCNAVEAMNRLQWTEQKRLVHLLQNIVLQNGILPEWEIIRGSQNAGM